MIYEQNQISISEETFKDALADAMRRVYNWMGLGLLVTALVALALNLVPSLMGMIFSIPLMPWPLFILQIGMVWGLSAMLNRLSPAAALAWFLAYAGVMGITMSLIFVVYELGSIVVVFGVTMLTFFSMSMIGYTTKTDLTAMGSFLMMALIGLILASIANFFLQSPALYWITTYAGVLIFVGLTAYDTQKIKRWTLLALQSGNDTQLKRVAVIGALELYLDFINIFLYLLRILGRRR